MKTFSLFLFILTFKGINTFAQTSHSITINHNLYGQLFTDPQTQFLGKENFRFLWPRFNYRIEKDKQSLSGYLSVYGRESYLDFEPKAGELHRYLQVAIGVNYGYKLVSKNRIELRAVSGLAYIRNDQTEIIRVYPYELIIDGIDEWDLGIQTGIDLNFPIWKGIFLSSNVLYTICPWQSKSLTNQNIIVGMGLGYKFGR